MHIVIIVVAVLVNIPVVLMIGWALFGTWRDFFESLWLAVTYAPWHDFDLDEVSQRRRTWATIHLVCFAISVAAFVYGEHAAIEWLAPGWLASL